MEFGSRKPSDPGESFEGLRKLSRHVLVQAVRDLARNLKDKEQIVLWMTTQNYVDWVQWAGWEREWVDEFFQGIIDLRPAVRREVGIQCARGLMAISHLD